MGLLSTKYPSFRKKAPATALLIAACVFGVSCHTTGKTQPVPNATHGQTAPVLSDIVATLRANDDALRDFRAAATFTLESPKLEAVQRFPGSSVAYRRPADLYVVGRNALGSALFKLTSRGPEFLIEFPAVSDVDDRYYCSTEGEEIAKVPFPVAPADVAHEMFMPIDWAETADKDVRLVGFDDATGEATLECRTKNGLLRRVIARGSPWNITHNTLADRAGTVLSDTTMDDYIATGGVRLPGKVEAWFPEERTRITFELRNVRINTGLPDSTFNITWPPGQ